MIVAIVVLAVVYVCALSFRKRKGALGRTPSCLTWRPIQKGTESICRRGEKPMTMLPKRVLTERGPPSRARRYAKPAELLVVNPQTARMLGLIVPSSLLGRADEIID